MWSILKVFLVRSRLFFQEQAPGDTDNRLVTKYSYRKGNPCSRTWLISHLLCLVTGRTGCSTRHMWHPWLPCTKTHSFIDPTVTLLLKTELYWMIPLSFPADLEWFLDTDFKVGAAVLVTHSLVLEYWFLLSTCYSLFYSYINIQILMCASTFGVPWDLLFSGRFLMSSSNGC